MSGVYRKYAYPRKRPVNVIFLVFDGIVRYNTSILNASSDCNIHLSLVTPESVIVSEADVGSVFSGVTASLPEAAMATDASCSTQLGISSPDADIVSDADMGSIFAGVSLTIPETSMEMSAQSITELSDKFEMEMTIPSLELLMYGPSLIDCELPGLSLEIEGRTGKVANINAIIPSLSMTSFAGSNFIGNIPLITMSIESTSVDATLELTGDLSASIPSLRMRTILKPPDYFEASIPVLTMTMISQQTGDNYFDLTLPSLIAAINSGDISDGALRYVRGDIR